LREEIWFVARAGDSADFLKALPQFIGETSLDRMDTPARPQIY